MFDGAASIGATQVLPRIRFELPAAEWTCLLGPSGVGKTTLLRLIAGVADEATLDGTIAASDGAPLAGRIAMMAQDALLLPWLSVAQNAMLGDRLRGAAPDPARADKVLAGVGLAAHAQKRPGALSGGQRQRAALARTLMEDRPVVLLDEPFSALDARTRVQMQELTATRLRGCTVLMVTHDPAEAARLGQRILILSETGLAEHPAPPEAPPRAVDGADTLAAQGALLARLRGAA
ncbi:ABC transporter ATP-binding protein [Roseovarius spongiae]|uniref:ABC transporter ATP-binding protein n=1 Tax=Roseovarius spongiae TaxID=2320272 RepID=A0A3A8ASS2_9RHOB|nr:ABC transporter ATP-binding protein [Roseovarius spongiae]